tara:strand:- start:174 stop:401 length:228 start_codon:yes stop_codon:yes gene_type:complete
MKKKAIITWSSKNGVVMGAKLEETVDIKAIEDRLNEELPKDPTKLLSEFMTQEDLDFFNPVDVETSNYKIKFLDD